jgi:hypothetical protein
MARSIRRSTKSEDDEAQEETRPSSRRRPGAARPSRRSNDEESGSSKSSIDEGWDSFDKYAKETASGDFAEDLEVKEDEPVIIKILDDKPVTYKQHWVEGLGKGKKKSYVCYNDGCPLCDDLGDKPRAMGCFNVVDFSDPENPIVKILRQGPQVNNLLKKFASEKKSSPLNREDLYFEISKTSVNKKVTYSLLPVKERDLQDDYDVEPLTPEELAEFEEQRYETDQIVKATPKAELREIAEDLLD